jgi:para-aminobenzoate synthetase component 1
MKVLEIENFVYLPFPGDSGRGKLHVLGKQTTYALNAFVHIPYVNPKQTNIAVHYYPILSSHEVDLGQEPVSSAPEPIRPIPSLKKEEYIRKVEEIKKHIQYGNIYEINYCMNFLAEQAELDSIHTFIALQQKANAPYAALVKLGKDYILCASPELFLKKQNNTLITKPIKGTARRGKTVEEDEQLKQELHTSLKERTENVMAVDVARNDLSIIAERASVNVDTLFVIESFATVHQMVSTVSCQVKTGTHFEEIIKATFPMASMTGAPKTMAMDLISEFEDFDRHYYSGSFGILDENGDFELNVVIRSIFYNSENKRLSFAVGGAITYLSDPEEEYKECLLKAENLLRVLG